MAVALDIQTTIQRDAPRSDWVGNAAGWLRRADSLFAHRK